MSTLRTRAIIADDEPLLAAALERQLAELWPELTLLTTASHGEAALDAILHHRPQVAFLDIQMPGMTGLDVARALAEDWPDNTKTAPLLVFVTAFDQYAITAFEASAFDYLLKPVTTERLGKR